MLRKLLILLCLAIATNAVAQVNITPVKTTPKEVVPEIDYKQAGAPMPRMKLLSYHDSGGKKGESTALKDSNAASEPRSKKRKKQLEEEKKIAKHHYITNEDLDNNANLFVMMFNPTCSHCIDETEMLEKNIGLFKRSKLVLIANTTNKDYIAHFVSNNHVADYPAIYVGMDSSDFWGKVFLYQALPQISIYDHNRNLIKSFTGEKPIDSLEKYIQ